MQPYDDDYYGEEEPLQQQTPMGAQTTPMEDPVYGQYGDEDLYGDEDDDYYDEYGAE